jgi:hypothetical protein
MEEDCHMERFAASLSMATMTTMRMSIVVPTRRIRRKWSSVAVVRDTVALRQ